MTDSNLQDLIRAVQEADSSALLLDAVQALADAQQPEAVPLLLEALGYNNPGVAVAAVDGLIKLGEPAVQPLLEQLDGHNYSARAWGVRALAGIGDPRGLPTLLDTLKTDFAMSVRRAAARGLGIIRWQEMDPETRPVAQAEALEALLESSQDSEWIVRYAAVTGLQAMAIALYHTEYQTQIEAVCDRILQNDDSLAVRARTQLVLHSLNGQVGDRKNPAADWYATLEQLYYRKSEERPVPVPEGDPRRFREVAASLSSLHRSE